MAEPSHITGKKKQKKGSEKNDTMATAAPSSTNTPTTRNLSDTLYRVPGLSLSPRNTPKFKLPPKSTTKPFSCSPPNGASPPSKQHSSGVWSKQIKI
jgi:hypothetical protein